jgi:hypothetical protein
MGASLPAGAQLGEPGGGTPLLGIRNDMKRRAQGMGISHRGAPLGSLEGDSFAGDLCVKEGSGDGHLSL